MARGAGRGPGRGRGRSAPTSGLWAPGVGRLSLTTPPPRRGKPRPGEAGSQPSTEREAASLAWNTQERRRQGTSLLGQPLEPSENRKFQPRAPPWIGAETTAAGQEGAEEGAGPRARQSPRTSSQEKRTGQAHSAASFASAPGGDGVSVLCDEILLRREAADTAPRSTQRGENEGSPAELRAGTSQTGQTVLGPAFVSAVGHQNHQAKPLAWRRESPRTFLRSSDAMSGKACGACASDEDGPAFPGAPRSPSALSAGDSEDSSLDASTAGCRGQSHPARGVSPYFWGQQECTADRTGAAQGKRSAVRRRDRRNRTLVPSRAKEASRPGIQQKLH